MNWNSNLDQLLLVPLGTYILDNDDEVIIIIDPIILCQTL